MCVKLEEFMDQVDVGQENSSVETVTVDQVKNLEEQVKSLMATNERLVHEHKKYKSRAEEVESSLEDMEKQKLQEAGKTEELLELEKNKSHEATLKAKKFEREAKKRALQLEVASRARDAHDVMDVVKNLNPELISYDDDLGMIKGIDDAVKEIRKAKPYLFSSNSVPATPSGRPEAQIPSELTIDDKIAENPTAMLRELLRENLK